MNFDVKLYPLTEGIMVIFSKNPKAAYYLVELFFDGEGPILSKVVNKTDLMTSFNDLAYGHRYRVVVKAELMSGETSSSGEESIVIENMLLKKLDQMYRSTFTTL